MTFASRSRVFYLALRRFNHSNNKPAVHGRVFSFKAFCNNGEKKINNFSAKKLVQIGGEYFRRVGNIFHERERAGAKSDFPRTTRGSVNTNERREKRSGARTLCVNFPPTRTTTTTTPKKALTWRAQQAARVHGGRKEEKSGLDRRIPLAESGGIDRSFVSRPIEFQPKLARFAAQQRFVIEISANLRIILDRGF